MLTHEQLKWRIFFLRRDRFIRRLTEQLDALPTELQLLILMYDLGPPDWENFVLVEGTYRDIEECILESLIE